MRRLAGGIVILNYTAIESLKSLRERARVIMAIDKLDSTVRPSAIRGRGDKRQQPKPKRDKKPRPRKPEGKIDELA